MGGRGASSGRSKHGNEYGTQYKTVLEYGNVKFVQKRSRQSEPLMETMTKGRMYVTVGGDSILRITYFDNKNKRSKVLERDKRTGDWHAHHGYNHTENSKEKHGELSVTDRATIDKVKKIWENRDRV